MSDLSITAMLLVALLLILGSGVWVGLTLTGVAWMAVTLFSSRPAGDAMAGLYEVGSHPHAHASKPDETDIH